MANEHRDALRLLIPLEMEGDFEADLEVEGEALDELEGLVEQMLLEMSPATAEGLIADWERTCGITTDEEDTFERRQARVIAALRQVGGLSRQYYTDLAASLGHTIEIENYFPFVAGYGVAGEQVAADDIQWQVTIRGLSQSGYYFRAGHSRAGERLGYNSDSLEALFEALHPAHVKFIYEYDY